MPSTISEIDFTTPSRKRKLEDEGQASDVPSCDTCIHDVYSSIIDKDFILDKLYSVYPDAAIFITIPGFLPPQASVIQQSPATPVSSPAPQTPNESPVTTALSPDTDLPPLLSSLFSQENVGCTAASIQKLCHDAFDNMTVTVVQAENLRSFTMAQSESALWFDHRLGRITASRMHDVLKYTGHKYPKSIVSAIMQYTSGDPDLPALKWGRENEAVAREEYVARMKEMHRNFRTSLSGLMINPAYPYLAASPDGVSSCDCCGTRLLEIKCPYVFRNESPTTDIALTNSRFCLIKNESNIVMLSRKHI